MKASRSVTSQTQFVCTLLVNTPRNMEKQLSLEVSDTSNGRSALHLLQLKQIAAVAITHKK